MTSPIHDFGSVCQMRMIIEFNFVAVCKKLMRMIIKIICNLNSVIFHEFRVEDDLNWAIILPVVFCRRRSLCL
ncbi:MAG: hypothetical protein VX570_03900, partial [Pseudomonadota bacterium]|nr:hypothetical protein [Pseudomonadota bacterium]